MTLVHKERTGDPVGERFQQTLETHRYSTGHGDTETSAPAEGLHGVGRHPMGYGGGGDSGRGAEMKERDWRVWGRHRERRHQGLGVAGLWPSPPSPAHQGLPSLFPYSPNTAHLPPGLPRTFRDWPHCFGALEQPRAAGGGKWTSGCCSHSRCPGRIHGRAPSVAAH